MVPTSEELHGVPARAGVGVYLPVFVFPAFVGVDAVPVCEEADVVPVCVVAVCLPMLSCVEEGAMRLMPSWR